MASRPVDLAYCAGLIDGEGCIRVNRECPRPSQHRKARYSLQIGLAMLDSEAPKFAKRVLGGSLGTRKSKGKLYTIWRTTDANAEEVLKAIVPFLHTKKAEAELGIEYRKAVSFHRGHALSRDELALRHGFFEAFKELKRLAHQNE